MAYDFDLFVIGGGSGGIATRAGPPPMEQRWRLLRAIA